MNYFHNKVIWITGATSGIGEALAQLCSAKNAFLVLSSRRISELERVKNMCSNPDRILLMPLDLSQSQSVNELTAKVISKFGKIDFLINNGGVSQRSLAQNTPLDVDRLVMETNFFGTIALTKSVLPHMLSQKSGHITVISSITGKFGYYYRSAYSASKHALHGFFESLRLEVEKNNIKILMVCPGKIKTNISLNAINEKGARYGGMDEKIEEGMSVEECAEQILQAIKKEKEEVLIGRKEILTVYMKQFLPFLFSKIIRKVKPE